MKFQCLSALVLVGVCWGGSRNLRDELKNPPAKDGFAIAMFDHGKVSTASWDQKSDWQDVGIREAVGHAWSYEGMLSQDGKLAAFPYWPTHPCPSRAKCDISASSSYYLAIVRTDGGDSLRTYSQIILPSNICWARDNSKIAMIATLDKDPQKQLIILDVQSGTVDRISNGEHMSVTAQCWSPDGKQLAYFQSDKGFFRPGSIRIFDTVARQTRELLHDESTACAAFCTGAYPTWSPDGEWIAYLQNKTYWAVHPSGEGRRELFRHSSALSPLQWSPDMRYALYADCCAFRDTWRCMCEIGRIHVRRFSDGADIKISGDGYQNMFLPRWTWIQKRRSN